jgi:hypothetical protein
MNSDEKIARLRAARLARDAEARNPNTRWNATHWDIGASSALEQAERTGSETRIRLIDEVVEKGISNIDDLSDRYGGDHVRDAHFAHVTMMVHGRPREGMAEPWLNTDCNARTCTIHPAFAEAWRKLRRWRTK